MRVLLVEDEIRLAEHVRRGLAAEGFVVDVVHDGAEGLFKAQVSEQVQRMHADGHSTENAFKKQDLFITTIRLMLDGFSK